MQPMTYEGKANCFRLSPTERRMLDTRNGLAHTKAVKAQDEIMDIMAIAIDRINAGNASIRYVWMTSTEYQQHHNDELGKYTAKQVGEALTAICGESKRMRHNVSQYLVPNNTASNSRLENTTTMPDYIKKLIADPASPIC